jgi:hypothetical protein
MLNNPSGLVVLVHIEREELLMMNEEINEVRRNLWTASLSLCLIATC